MSELAFREWYLNHNFKGDNLTLSERVTSPRFVAVVAESIRLNMKAGLNLRTMVKKLETYTTAESLSKEMRNVESLARRVAAGDTKLMSEFTKVLNEQRRIITSRMTEVGARTPTQLTKAYEKVLNAAEKLNVDALNKTVQNAIQKKAASNAFRIAHTESARAYGLGMRTQVKSNPFATGITWDISLDESNCEDCLALDGKNFTLGNMPEYPQHPHCSCNLTPYFGNDFDDSDEETDDSTIPKEILES